MSSVTTKAREGAMEVVRGTTSREPELEEKEPRAEGALPLPLSVLFLLLPVRLNLRGSPLPLFVSDSVRLTPSANGVCSPDCAVEHCEPMVL